MVLLEDDSDEFISILESVTSAESPQQYQDVQLELLSKNHPLAALLDTKLCPLPCVLASSHHEKECKDESEVVVEEKSMESYEGSPMRLRSITSPDVPREGKPSISQPLYYPVSIDRARFLVSMYNLEAQPGDTCRPLVVLCNGEDAEGIAVMAAHKQTLSGGQPEIHIYTANIKGPLSSKTKFLLPGSLVKELGFTGLNSVEVHCSCNFDIYHSSIQNTTLQGNSVDTTHQGALRILCEWRTLTQPLQIPYLDATTVVEAHVFPGDVKSVAHSFYKDICLLKGMVSGLHDGVVYWYTADAEVSVIDRLKQYITRLSQSCEQEEGEQVKPTFEQLIIATRQDLDFTEEVWNILKDCQRYQDLIDGFHLLVKALSSGTIQPSIHSRSQSRLADIIRRSYMEPARLIELTDLQPLEALAEIGVEKLTKDHVHHLVSNDLVTAAQMDQFLSAGDTLEEQLVLLEKVHHAVELAVSLDQFLKLPKQAVSYGAREVLKYFGDNDLENRAFVFKIPVKKKHLDTIISGLQPLEWRAMISSKQTSPQEHAVVLLSPEPPFTHIHQDTPVIDGMEDDVDIVGTYYQTTVHHQVICM